MFRMERIRMSKQLKAIAIFAGMIVLPIVADNLISKRPDIRLFGSFGWSWALVPIIILLAAGIPYAISAYWKFKEDIEQIESWLKIAERELLKLLGDNWDQAGRHTKIKERAEWNAMAQTPLIQVIKPQGEPKDRADWPPIPQTAFTQVFQEGYRTVAHEAFELNKTDVVNRGKAMGKASMTAVLLRELYQGSSGRARAKIAAELAAGGDPPFVAPGIRELIAFKDGKLEEKAPFDWIKLTLAVRHGQFPKELLLVDKKPEETKIMRGWEVIMQLTQQREPDWQKPEHPKPSAPMWRLWLEWLFTVE